MFINPKVAIQEGWVTHRDCKTVEDWETRNFISPNAIDFTLDRLFSINSTNGFHISEGGKKMRGGSEIHPVSGSRSISETATEIDSNNNTPYWKLTAGEVYDGMSDLYVDVPEGVAAFLITRSTFNRNGVFITSGLYDSGFQNNVGFIIHNYVGLSFISPGTRIGQIIFVNSESAKLYQGSYNNNAGQHWTTNMIHQEGCG